MGGEVHHRGLHVLGGQVLRNFQADEAAAGHHSPLDVAGLHRFPQGNGVIGGTHDKYVLQIQALDRGDKGGRAGGDNQLVVPVLLHLAGLQIPGLHLVFGAFDGGGLHLRQHLRAGEPGELLRGVDDQLPLLMDDIAHIVGQAAAGVGDVLALCQNRDLAAPVLPQELGRSFCSGGHAA